MGGVYYICSMHAKRIVEDRLSRCAEGQAHRRIAKIVICASEALPDLVVSMEGLMALGFGIRSGKADEHQA